MERKKSEQKKDKSIVLPQVAAPLGNYVPWVKEGGLVFISGQGPRENGSYAYCGKVGRDLTVAQAYDAARITGLNLLACLEQAAGGLENVECVLMLRGYVNSTDDFDEQPAVIDGVSDLLVEVLGDRGRSARCAISVLSLPKRIAVEAELVAKLKE